MRYSVVVLLLAVCCCIDGGASSRSRSRKNAAPSPRRHPATMMWSPHDGSSPNLDMYVDDHHPHNSDQHSSSYYVRNDMNPPPLISHSTRRQLQSNTVGTEGTSDLDLIIEEAKLGNDAVTRLRRDLLWSTYYDKHAYPFDYAWYGQEAGSRTGIPIELDINFHRVFSVDTINPVLDVLVWFRLQWADPRLTWEPKEYGNMTKVWFWLGDGGAGGETSEIWTPDIELWNLQSGLSETLDDSYAVVSYDGSVYWSRPGHLRPTCKFYGLNNFPFDELTCTMEFGSWTYSGKYMRLVMGGADGDGFSLGGSETAGASFNEFSFVEENPISCVPHVYPPYPISPEEDWPVLMYNVTIGRSWQPYARGYILLQVMLNCVGFAAFWLPPSCGERMGLSITSMLAAVAAEVVIASNLPAAAELTWFQKFNILSQSFAFISLLESVAVLYFFYKKTDNIIPHWYSFARDWYLVRQASKGKDAMYKRGSDLVDSISQGVKDVVTKRESDMVNDAAPTNDTFEENGDRNNTQSAATPTFHRASLSDNSSFDDGNNEDIAADDLKPKENTNQTDLNDSSASLSVGDVDFGVLTIEPKSTGGTRDNPLAASFVSTLSNDGDPLSNPITDTSVGKEEPAAKPKVRFNVQEEERDTPRSSMRRQSLHLQSRSTMLQRQSTQESTRSLIVPRDANDFADENEIESNLKWKKLSVQIDDFSRVWIPISFFIALPILFVKAHP